MATNWSSLKNGLGANTAKFLGTSVFRLLRKSLLEQFSDGLARVPPQKAKKEALSTNQDLFETLMGPQGLQAAPQAQRSLRPKANP